MTGENQWTVSLVLLKTHPSSRLLHTEYPTPYPHLPFLWIQVTAAHSDGEETWGTIWWTVAVQETPHIEAKVHSSGQIIGVCIHSPNNLSSTKPLVSGRPMSLGFWEPTKCSKDSSVGMVRD